MLGIPHYENEPVPPLHAGHSQSKVKLMNDTKTFVLYHAGCPDGFGGAYAAWKKFGDTATYIPLSHGDPTPEGLAGAQVYFIDFCYKREQMDAVVAIAKSVTVLDHHEGVQEVVEAMPEFVYDKNRSGASIAWTYFHPDTPLPKLLTFVEDDDLFRFALPDTKAVLAYLPLQPYDFSVWDALVTELENLETREVFLAKARIYREYFDLLVALAVGRAKKIMFEGYECYLGESLPMKPMESAIGNALAEKSGNLGLIVHSRRSAIRVSLRSQKGVDVSAIARKYGGNGHPQSSAFSLSYGDPIPWTVAEEEK